MISPSVFVPSGSCSGEVVLSAPSSLTFQRPSVVNFRDNTVDTTRGVSYGSLRCTTGCFVSHGFRRFARSLVARWSEVLDAHPSDAASFYAHRWLSACSRHEHAIHRLCAVVCFSCWCIRCFLHVRQKGCSYCIALSLLCPHDVIFIRTFLNTLFSDAGNTRRPATTRATGFCAERKSMHRGRD